MSKQRRPRSDATESGSTLSHSCDSQLRHINWLKKNWNNDKNLNVRKRTFEHKRPVKIQISLRFRWTLFWIAKDAKFLHADNKVHSYQAAQMRMLIWYSLGAHVRRYALSRYGSEGVKVSEHLGWMLQILTHLCRVDSSTLPLRTSPFQV